MNREQINKGFDALHESVASIVTDDGVDKADALAETMGQAHEWFQKLVADAATADIVAAVEKNTEATAYDKLMQLAEELRKAEPKLSEAQAFAKVYQASENRELVHAEREERRTVDKRDAGDRIAECAAALRASRDMSVDEALATVKRKNPDLVAAFKREQEIAKDDGAIPSGGTDTARARIYARAAALCRQFAGMTATEALDHVLERNPAGGRAASIKRSKGRGTPLRPSVRGGGSS